MSEPENFLARWSRRKLETEQESGAPPEHADKAPSTADQPPNTDRTSPNKPEQGAVPAEPPAFDITQLPSLESITSETDIRLFLQKGVPAELTRAALRRAWTADPAIRDFIEIAENQYDFATGSDLPGFGPLDASADDIRKMVANVFGGGPKTLTEQEATTPPDNETPAKPGSSEVAEPSAEPTVSEDTAATPQDQPPEVARAEPVKDVVQRHKVTVAMQQSNTKAEYDPMPFRRPHGRALPQ